MVKAEQMDTFIEIQQPFRNFMKAKEFLVAAIDIVNGNISPAQLSVKGVTKPRPDVQKRKKTRRIEAAAMPKPRANFMIIVGGDGLEHVQHGNGEFQHVVGASQQTRGICKVALIDQVTCTLQFPHNSLQQQLR